MSRPWIVFIPDGMTQKDVDVKLLSQALPGDMGILLMPPGTFSSSNSDSELVRMARTWILGGDDA